MNYTVRFEMVRILTYRQTCGSRWLTLGCVMVTCERDGDIFVLLFALKPFCARNKAIWEESIHKTELLLSCIAAQCLV